MGDKGENLSIKKYIDVIRSNVSDIKNNHKTQGRWKFCSGNTITEHKTQGEWKVNLTMTINYISSKEASDENCATHAKSDNIEIMIASETDEIIEELFKSLLLIYQEGLEESMKGNEFIFDSVDVLYYDLNKISLNRGGLYIDSLEWLKNKKTTINPKSNDDKCFQYAITMVLNHEQIKIHPERLSKIKPFIDQYNLREISCPSHKKDWQKFESNNKSLA